MNSHSEYHGKVEVGVVEHEGREYRAFGSVITDTHITAYLGKDGKLTTWDGKVIGTYRITRTWRTPRSFVSSTMNQVYATVDGRTYQGRSAGVGMVFNGKLVHAATVLP
jgi:hypothetical protein